MSLISKFTGLGSLKMTLIVASATAAIVGSTAFIAGVRWEKADRYDEAVAQIQLIEAQATQSLDALNDQWQDVAKQAQIRVEDWTLQNAVDEDMFDRLLNGQSEIRSKFNDLERDIFITTDFGTCKLSDDAVRLLRKAAFIANAGVSES